MPENEIALRIKFQSEGGQQVVQNVDALAASAEQVKTNFTQADESAVKLGTTATQIASGELVESTNKLQTAIGGLQAGLRTVGLGAVGEKLQGLMGLGSAIKDIGEQAGITNAITSMLPAGLGATAAGFAAVALPVAAVTLALAPLAIALKLVKDRSDAAAASAEAVAKMAGTQGDIVAEVDSVVRKNDKQGALDLLIKAQDQFQEGQAKIAYLQSQMLGADEETAKKLQEQIDAIQIDKMGSAAFAMQQLNDAFPKLGITANDVMLAINKANNNFTESDKEFAKSADEAAEALKKQTEANEAAAKKFADNMKELGANTTKILDLEAKRSAQIADRVLTDSRNAEVAALESKIKDAEQRESAQATQNKITQIREEGGQAEAQAAQKTRARIDDINRSFMDNELKALETYRKNEERATQDYSKNRVRKLADLYDDLTDLAAKGDVAAFVNARKAGLKDISRGDEDFGDAAARRRQDYEDQRKAAQEARDKQIQDVIRSAQEESAARQVQLMARIKQEEAAGKTQLTQSQKLQNDLAALRKRYADADLAAKRQAEDNAYEITINGLRRRQAELGASVVATFTPAVNTINMLGGAIASLINKAKAAIGGGGSSASASTGRIAAGGSGGNFASGRGGASVNVASNYMPATSGGGTVVNVYANVGELVTPSQLNTQVNEIIHGVRLAVTG